MHRTEGQDHASNLFTDGPPGTFVESNWLNAIQEEICNVIESAGLTLKTASTDTRDQLQSAIAAAAVSPPGTLEMIIGTETPPTGWLECDGSSLLKASYPDLFSGYERSIGTAYGSVDADHFNLPDLRGRFIRAWDHGRGSDPDAAGRADRGDGTTGDHVGTIQGYEVESHSHYGVPPLVSTTHRGGNSSLWALNFSSVAYTYSYGGNETRPKNVNVMFVIKT
jgi:microcystin-dependent protein